MIHGAKWETPPVGPGLGGMLITSLSERPLAHPKELVLSR